MWTRTFHAKGSKQALFRQGGSSLQVQCQAPPPVLGISWLGEQTEGTLRREAVLRVRWGGGYTSCLLESRDFCTDDSLGESFFLREFLFSFLQSQETREILHFHYTTWPDFGVPESPASFLNFLFKVRESGSLSTEHGPVVVHCSAGIGRSGTFCLADTCLLLVRRPLKTPGREGSLF